MLQIETLRADATRVLAGQRKRLARRCDAIRGDLARIDEAQELARLAALAAPQASRVRRSAKSIRVVDYSKGNATTIEIAIDPARGARESLERIFKNAKRLRAGAIVASDRLREAERSIAVIDAALAAIAIAEDAEAIDAACATAKIPSQKKSTRERGKALQERKPPFRTFRTPNGVVLVGRGAARNEELTFRVAKPYHLFLHVRGAPGAHVIVPLRREQSCPSELLVDAAHLAAHFSDARGELLVEVSYVQRKFVRKPKGSPPGTVTMEREKVLALRFDETRCKHLLTLESDQNA